MRVNHEVSRKNQGDLARHLSCVHRIYAVLDLTHESTPLVGMSVRVLQSNQIIHRISPQRAVSVASDAWVVV